MLYLSRSIAEIFAKAPRLRLPSLADSTQNRIVKACWIAYIERKYRFLLCEKHRADLVRPVPQIVRPLRIERTIAPEDSPRLPGKKRHPFLKQGELWK